MQLFNFKGFSLVEILVGLGLLSAVGLGVMKFSSVQQKAVSGLNNTSDLANTMNILDSVLRDADTCSALVKGKVLDSKLTSIQTASGAEVIRIGSKTPKDGYELTDITVGSYHPVLRKSKFTFSFKKINNASRSDSLTRSVSFFPVFSSGTTMESCLNGNQIAAESALSKICKDFDAGSVKDCLNIYEDLLYDVKKHYCSSPPFSFDAITGKCKRLNSSQKCPDGGFVQSIDKDGKYSCYFPPPFQLDPQNPSICTSWSPWSPDLGSACTNQMVSQSQTCTSGDFATQTRQLPGTKNDATCCPAWSEWTPLASNICKDKIFDQTRSCGTNNQMVEKRTAVGTKTIGECEKCNFCYYEIEYDNLNQCNRYKGNVRLDPGGPIRQYPDDNRYSAKCFSEQKPTCVTNSAPYKPSGNGRSIKMNRYIPATCGTKKYCFLDWKQGTRCK